jgi:hypothetical protein
MQRLERQGQSWDQLDDFLALRTELFEIDLRYGQLGPKGLFNTLDAAGVLNHEILTAEAIHQAIGNPPPSGRAKRRGEAIRRLASTHSGCTCNWATIVDHHNARIIRMHDPFVSSDAHWETVDEPEEESSDFCSFNY